MEQFENAKGYIKKRKALLSKFYESNKFHRYEEAIIDYFNYNKLAILDCIFPNSIGLGEKTAKLFIDSIFEKNREIIFLKKDSVYKEYHVIKNNIIYSKYYHNSLISYVIRSI